MCVCVCEDHMCRLWACTYAASPKRLIHASALARAHWLPRETGYVVQIEGGNRLSFYSTRSRAELAVTDRETCRLTGTWTTTKHCTEPEHSRGSQVKGRRSDKTKDGGDGRRGGRSGSGLSWSRSPSSARNQRHDRYHSYGMKVSNGVLPLCNSSIPVLHGCFNPGSKAVMTVWCSEDNGAGEAQVLRGVCFHCARAHPFIPLCSAVGINYYSYPHCFSKNGWMDACRHTSPRENVFTADVCAIWRLAAEWFHSARP